MEVMDRYEQMIENLRRDPYGFNLDDFHLLQELYGDYKELKSRMDGLEK